MINIDQTLSSKTCHEIIENYCKSDCGKILWNKQEKNQKKNKTARIRAKP